MKNYKKISATLLSVSMLMSAMSPAYALKITNKDYDEPSKTATVTIANQDGEDANACLVAVATDNATQKLVAINKDEKTVPKKTGTTDGEATLTTVLSYPDGDYTYDIYVWDSILTHIPLTNTPPTNVKNAVATAKTNSIDISWDKALDDKAVKSYILRADGKEVGRTNTNSYSIEGLEQNKSYNYEILACDEEGLTSKMPAVISATTHNTEECILYLNNNPNFSFYENHTANTLDSFTEPDNIAGRDCFTNKTQDLGDKKKVCFFYFPVASTYISSTVKNVAFEVTYYDDSDSSSPSIQYNAADGSSGKSVSLEGKTGTKTWKTVYAQVDDAKFINPEALTYSAFRVSAPSGTRVYSVKLCPGENYAPDAPNVKFSNTTDIYDMYFYPDDAKNAYGIDYTSIDEIPCMYAKNGGTFEFDINDARADKNGGYVEVTYFDSGEDSLVLNYNNAVKPEVEFTNSYEFKTVQIPLVNAKFQNDITGANGKAFDFTLSTKNGSPLALTAVKYVPGGTEPEQEPEPEEPDYDPETDDEIYAMVNVTGKKIIGSLALKSWAADPGKDNTNDGYDHNILLSGKMKKSEQDGKHYMYNALYGDSTSWRLYKNAFYFDVPSTFIDGTVDEDVQIEVECYIPSGQLQIEFGDGITRTNTVTPNKWVKSTFLLTSADAISFNGGIEGSDFRIYVGSCQGYIHKVTMRKGDAIVDEPEPEEPQDNVLSYTMRFASGYETGNEATIAGNWDNGGHGITFWLDTRTKNGDDSAARQKGGKWCRTNEWGTIFYYQVPGVESSETKLTIEFDYYDDAAANGDDITLTYYTTGGKQNGVKTVKYTGTNTWKTASFDIDNAKFFHDSDNGDFYITDANGNFATTYVKVYPATAPTPTQTNEVFAEVNSEGTALTSDSTLILNTTESYAGGSTGYDFNICFSGNASSGKSAFNGKHYMYNAEDGRTDWHKWKNAFYFKVPDEFLKGEITVPIEIEVECVMPDGGLDFEYVGTDGSQHTKTFWNISKTDWDTLTITINPSDGVSFNNSLSGSNDFRFYARNGQGKIHKVTIRKVSN